MNNDYDSANNPYIIKITDNLSELQDHLKIHPLYKSLNSLDDIKIFMENHIFAVWDFMSLLKSLQNQLTNISVPWTPSGRPLLARFINEIVLGEESDVNEFNEPKSHFEMYLDAMGQIGAKKKEIEALIVDIKFGKEINNSIQSLRIDGAVKDFLQFSFNVINTKKIHKIASAFTYGREDIIPDMFISILKKIDPKNNYYTKLKYYLDRHIEIDGGLHGPLAQKMLIELCINDSNKWDEVNNVAKTCLQYRIKLWDSILKQIEKNTIEKSQENLVNT